MTKTIEITVNKEVFKFKETIYKEQNVFYIKSVSINQYKKIKLIIRGRDHNPPHIHLYYYIDDFRFNMKQQSFFKKDIENNEGFFKLKSNKRLYKAILKYFEMQKEKLIESFYILNPTLLSEK